MKNLSIYQKIVIVLTVLTMVCALVIPSIYVDAQNLLIMGWTTTFGGTIKLGTVQFCWQLLLAWLLPLGGCLLVAFLGKSQKSTYFFALCFFLASGIMYAFTSNFFNNINVAGSIRGIGGNVLCAQPFVMIALNAIQIIVCLVAMIYKPSKRYSRY